ncbi:MAG: DNA topoisomerase III [Ottowia sp.]|nr:DNA topoisomerase III [Ottowia sp.]
MKTLVIAEKPSVARDIVNALAPDSGKFQQHAEYWENERYIVTSAIGHLVEIQAPDEYEVKRGKWSFANLPVVPPHFDLKPVAKTRTRLNAVVRLARRKDVGQLINACDAGREGELIFRLIEQYAGGGKSLGKPIKRLWLQSMTPQAIRSGFEQLRSEQQMQGLADAARSRSEADWLVGINGTRAMTAFNSQAGGFFLTTVGRVQTPTLAVVVTRENEIRKHVARDYWEVETTFAAEAGSYSGKWFDPEWKKDPQDADKRANRLWDEAQARAIAQAVQGRHCSVEETSKPRTEAAKPLFDLTSLQREANGRFGYSAKTTLALAQSLYERHKALTYPRTDSQRLPDDYLPVARKTLGMIAGSGQRHLAPHAQKALDDGYVRPNKRIFDSSKVSDHFAIIPTTEAPGRLSEAEQKIYDLVVRRFLAVFYPSAEYRITQRVTTAKVQGERYAFRSDGKVLVKAGWLAVYGREVDGEAPGKKDKTLVAVRPDEQVLAETVEVHALQTRPPARYNEATLLGAMEGAGRLVDDDELRHAMQDKGLGTPATRATIIEGLIREKYLLREGRELVPTAKAFQLMTLLHGLEVDELSQPELTGEWEYKLAQIEKGELARSVFMREIAEMTERIVNKAKEYDRDTVPGDYATLQAPCPNCGGVVRENYRRYACTGKTQDDSGCGFSFTKTPGGRTFTSEEAEAFLHDRHIGPLEGFRSKRGWPFVAELALVQDQETGNWKLEFDFGEDARAEQTGEIVDLSGHEALGPCPKCGAPVKAFGKSYVCEKSVPTEAQPTPSCDFKSGQVILQQEVDAEQMKKLLSTGKTDLLERFISNRTRRPFKARLAWQPDAGKVGFEFEPREGKSKYPPRKPAGKTVARESSTARTARKSAAAAGTARKSAAKKATARKAAAKKTAAPRKPRAGNLRPSPELAAVIGNGPFGRGQVMKELWAYIKANDLQDPQDKRTIVADDKLKPVFGGETRVGMFKLAGIVGQHLS